MTLKGGTRRFKFFQQVSAYGLMINGRDQVTNTLYNILKTSLSSQSLAPVTRSIKTQNTYTK